LAKSQSSGLRLNQALAKTGFCSRRQADELIAAGRVSLNGAVTRDFSVTVDPQKDRLAVDGKLLAVRPYLYIAMHKPEGVVTTAADEKGRTDVLTLLPAELQHLRPVGRLDMYSEGLLILTNDGDLTQKLTHPMHHMPKLYRVTVKGRVSDKALTELADGVELTDGPTRPAEVTLVDRNKSYSELEITLYEGRNRQVRRMCEHVGYPVSRLVRVALGGLQLGQMPPGTWRYLTDAEVRILKSNQ
jgi:23S rRNA pseudouridine2605 synthase